MSKDSDFRDLRELLTEGPQIIWLTCGNTSNARLKVILEAVWPRLALALTGGTRVIEIHDETSLA